MGRITGPREEALGRLGQVDFICGDAQWQHV